MSQPGEPGEGAGWMWRVVAEEGGSSQLGNESLRPLDVHLEWQEMGAGELGDSSFLK